PSSRASAPPPRSICSRRRPRATSTARPFRTYAKRSRGRRNGPDPETARSSSPDRSSLSARRYRSSIAKYRVRSSFLLATALLAATAFAFPHRPAAAPPDTTAVDRNDGEPYHLSADRLEGSAAAG